MLIGILCDLNIFYFQIKKFLIVSIRARIHLTVNVKRDESSLKLLRMSNNKKDNDKKGQTLFETINKVNDVQAKNIEYVQQFTFKRLLTLG